MAFAPRSPSESSPTSRWHLACFIHGCEASQNLRGPLRAVLTPPSAAEGDFLLSPGPGVGRDALPGLHFSLGFELTPRPAAVGSRVADLRLLHLALGSGNALAIAVPGRAACETHPSPCDRRSRSRAFERRVHSRDSVCRRSLRKTCSPSRFRSSACASESVPSPARQNDVASVPERQVSFPESIALSGRSAMSMRDASIGGWHRHCSMQGCEDKQNLKIPFVPRFMPPTRPKGIFLCRAGLNFSQSFG